MIASRLSLACGQSVEPAACADEKEARWGDLRNRLDLVEASKSTEQAQKTSIRGDVETEGPSMVAWRNVSSQKTCDKEWTHVE